MGTSYHNTGHRKLELETRKGKRNCNKKSWKRVLGLEKDNVAGNWNKETGIE